MRIKRTQNIYRIFITFVLILTFLQVATAEIKVSQSVSESKIAYEDTVQFEILVEWEGRQTDYLFNKPLTPFIDRMKIGKFSSSVSSQIIDGVEVTSKKYNYSLIPTSAGLGLIDSMYIAYLKRSDSISGMLLTEPMEILISNPVAKVKEEDDLNEWFIFGFVLVVIFGLFLLFKWKKNSQSVEIELSPKDQFLLDLEQIKKDTSSDMKKFQTELYSALSKYLATAYQVEISSVQKDLLIDELSKAGASITDAEQITRWLKQAEIDKYAPIAHAPGAVVRLESDIRKFFEKN